MKEKYRNSNRAKHRYKALERIYIKEAESVWNRRAKDDLED